MNSFIAIVAFFFSVVFSEALYAGWRTELNLGRPDHSLRLAKKTKSYRYISDPSVNWKVKFGYGPLKLSYGSPIKNTKVSGRSVPGSDYVDLEIRLYLNNLLAEYLYKKYQGFYAKDENIEDCNNCEIRNDLISRERSYQLFYALNPDFEIKKIVSVADNKISGFQFSFIITGGGNRWKISDPNGIFRGEIATSFPELNNLQEIRFNQYFLGIGVGVIVPISSLLHFSSFLTAAAGPLEYNIRDLNGDQTQNKSHIARNYNLKANLGTYGDGLNGGLRGVFLSNQYKMENDKSLFSIDYDILGYLSYSF